MKDTGIVRKIDGLGRIVLPKETRKALGIPTGALLEIYVEDNKIILQKFNGKKSLQEIVDETLSTIGKQCELSSYSGKIIDILMDLKEAIEEEKNES